MKNKIIPYNPKLKPLARRLRQQGIVSEILLWKQIQGKSLGVEFHRQVPMLDFIVDFYRHELMLAIEVGGLIHDYKDAVERDNIRQQLIEGYGVTFLRFNDSQIKKNITGVMQELENTVAIMLEQKGK